MCTCVYVMQAEEYCYATHYRECQLDLTGETLNNKQNGPAVDAEEVGYLDILFNYFLILPFIRHL